jgi:hypothetical protein
MWILGGLFLVAIQYGRVALLPTAPWRDFTLWLAALGAQ